MNEQPNNAIEILDPVEQVAVGQVIRQAAMGAGLEPWQAHKLQWKVKRERERLILQLAKLECDTVLAEAVVFSKARVQKAKELAAVDLFASQLRCLVRAGALRDEAMQETMALSEGSRDLIGGSIDRLTLKYARSVERRGGRSF